MREVKEILDAGFRKKKGQQRKVWLYKVAWRGEKGTTSWEIDDYLTRNMITDFFLAHPEKEAEKERGKRSNKRKWADKADGSNKQPK